VEEDCRHRHVLRHDYDHIASEVIYQVATENLDDLEEAVRRMLAGA
jgi:uncharacterized protein with HEPN domain